VELAGRAGLILAVVGLVLGTQWELHNGDRWIPIAGRRRQLAKQRRG